MQIVLYGTSSSGKTSLAQALQTLWPRPLIHIEADRFAPNFGSRHMASEDTDIRTRYVVAMHEAIAAFGRSGIDTIVDGSLPGERALRNDCFAILRRVPDTKVVAVRCSVDELRVREARRSDRPVGWAEEQSRTIYDGLEFDFNVDTTLGTAEDWARVLLPDLMANQRMVS